MNRPPSRRLVLLSVAALSLGLVLPAAARDPEAEPTRPNVVLIMTDDQGYGDLAAHGNPIIRTPALDRLWSEGVRLTNYHVDPTCSPTRSALMTGRYSGRVGVWHTIMGRSILRAGEVTMAEVFSRQGYVTGIFGKWHLGDNYPSRPQDRGFQEVFIHGGGGVGQTPDYWGNDYFDDTYLHNGRPEKVEGYCTDVWFDAALRFIEENRERPFLAYIPTNAAHGPFLVPERYKDMYQGTEGVPNAAFWGMITHIDGNVARLRKRLKELDLEKNTILIFTTDNGTAAGYRGSGGRGRRPAAGFNAGMRGTKGSQYDGGHRVPCFFYWPAGGLTGGRDVTRLTAHLDMLPTLIDLCGLKAPEEVRFDGTSIAPLLEARPDTWPERTLVVESQRIEHPRKWRQCSVMTDRWRLIDGRELYDMKVDPGQTQDVSPDHAAVVERLRAHYESWWKDVSRRHDEYCRIVLGNEAENPARLTCHDWHEGSPPWNQGHIRSGARANGFWAVEVARAGEYEIELRRWPEEASRAINDGPGVKALKARLKIAEVDSTIAVPSEAEAVTFRVSLEAGKTRLQTWFLDDEGSSRGAYYAYVKRLSG